MGLFNATCPLSKDAIDRGSAEQPFVGHLKAQDLLFYIAAGTAIVTTAIMVLLSSRHLRCYSVPNQQRQIIRVSFLPVVYAWFAAFSIYNYPDSLYLHATIGLYEPVALASLFFLFLHYVAPDPEARHSYFGGLENREQVQRFGGFGKVTGYRMMSGGSYRWFQSKWVAIYIYFFVTIAIHAVELITQAFGEFCQSSFSPAFAHIWVIVISYFILPVGVIAVIQFYARLRKEPEFRIHNPTRKIVAFKISLLFQALQDIIFDVLTSRHVFKPTKTFSAEDFSIGLPNVLIAFESMIWMSLYLWAFGTTEYREIDKDGQNSMGIFRAAANALNPWDLLSGVGLAAKWVGQGVGPRGNGAWFNNHKGYTGKPVVKNGAEQHLEPLSQQSTDYSHSMDQRREEPAKWYVYDDQSSTRLHPNIAIPPAMGYEVARARSTSDAESGYLRAASRDPSPEAPSTRRLMG